MKVILEWFIDLKLFELYKILQGVIYFEYFMRVYNHIL